MYVSLRIIVSFIVPASFYASWLCQFVMLVLPALLSEELVQFFFNFRHFFNFWMFCDDPAKNNHINMAECKQAVQWIFCSHNEVSRFAGFNGTGNITDSRQLCIQLRCCIECESIGYSAVFVKVVKFPPPPRYASHHGQTWQMAMLARSSPPEMPVFLQKDG